MLFVTVARAAPSSAELAADIVQDAQELVRLQVELAKQEAKELAVRNGIAAGLLAFGALLVMLALLVAAPALVVLLAPDHVIAAAVWLGVYLLLGVGLLLAGRLTLRLQALPRTVENFKETRTWLLRQIRSSGR